MKKELNTKKEFIRELAQRAQFTYKDTEIIYDTLEEIIQEKIANLERVNLSGIAILKPKFVKSHEGWDGIRREKMSVPDSYRLTVSPSKILVDILREKLLTSTDNQQEE